MSHVSLITRNATVTRIWFLVTVTVTGLGQNYDGNASLVLPGSVLKAEYNEFTFLYALLLRKKLNDIG
jgi:predicted transcriptional regulator with HTH domain